MDIRNREFGATARTGLCLLIGAWAVVAAGQSPDSSRPGSEAQPQETPDDTRARIARERLRPGTEFQDLLRSGGEGPYMVVIPAGWFEMGCVSGHECGADEFPLRLVDIPEPLAVSKYEVTFLDWDRCADAGGCGDYRPDDAGWGRDDRPVVHVSWEDAQSYVAWLSAQTGETYRLLSEAEWEYAARGDTETAYAWGDDYWPGSANCANCLSPWDSFGTAPAGSFEPNEFGLFDMHGNASEWVQDCANDSYYGAPSDGSAWLAGDCGRRILRGGSWVDQSTAAIRSPRRFHRPADFRHSADGFRVARVLVR